MESKVSLSYCMEPGIVAPFTNVGATLLLPCLASAPAKAVVGDGGLGRCVEWCTGALGHTAQLATDGSVGSIALVAR